MSDVEREILMRYGREWNVSVKNAFMAPNGPLAPAPQAPPGVRRTTRPHVLNYDFTSEAQSDAQVNPIRDSILAQVNSCLLQWQSPVRVQGGHQSYELLVRCGGVRGDYAALAGEMASRSFGGQNPAHDLLGWSQGSVPLHSLDDQLAALAVIIYFAEVGRGYAHEVGEFEDWIREKVQSQTSREAFASWQQFPKKYAFALTAAQDQGPDGLYTP